MTVVAEELCIIAVTNAPSRTPIIGFAVSFSRKREDAEDEKFNDDYSSESISDENIDLTVDSSTTESSSDEFLV